MNMESCLGRIVNWIGSWKGRGGKQRCSVQGFHLLMWDFRRKFAKTGAYHPKSAKFKINNFKHLSLLRRFGSSEGLSLKTRDPG